MPRLTRIELQGFRSISSLNLELTALNVLIGANGSGKSNLLGFFEMLRALAQDRLADYVARTGRAHALFYLGPKVTTELTAIIHFETRAGEGAFAFKIVPSPPDQVAGEITELKFRPYGLSIMESKPTRYSTAEFVGILEATELKQIFAESRVYHFDDTTLNSRLRGFCYLHDNQSLHPDGANLAAMLYRYQRTNPVVYRSIVSLVRKLLPGFKEFVLEPDPINPQEILLNWRRDGSEYLFGPHQFSDGSLRMIAIATLCLQPAENRPELLILDEPELGLHPVAINLLAGLIRAASVRSQVIVATQSETFLNQFAAEEVIVIDSIRGKSEFHRLEAVALDSWLENYTLGELWSRNVIGGGPFG
jgi:predicted ATPase